MRTVAPGSMPAQTVFCYRHAGEASAARELYSHNGRARATRDLCSHNGRASTTHQLC